MGMRVDSVRNAVLITILGMALAVSVVLEVRERQTRPQAVLYDETACGITAGSASEPARRLFCSGRLPVNTASAGDLERLEGIGPARARAIVEHRARHGPFHGPGDLERVRGLGPVTVGRLTPHIDFNANH
jgi:competence ComEA-like helix-hairpin-helix protein